MVAVGVALVALSLGAGHAPQAQAHPAAQAAGKPSIKVVSPAEGATITSTDTQVVTELTNFRLSPENVGRPDKEGEGHIHVMLDGMNMSVLFNFYTTPSCILRGNGIKPGQHKLIFELSTNTHMDMADTAKEVTINYQPTTPKAAPPPASVSGEASVQITSPSDGATVGPQFNLQVNPANFTPSEGLEGKQNLKGYGHYHLFVDMSKEGMGGDMSGNMASSTPESGGDMSGEHMMSMAGMISMPCSNSIPVNLSAWPAGKHTLIVEPVQNDHTTLQSAKHAMITILLQTTTAGSTGNSPSSGAAGDNSSLPRTGTGPDTLPLFAVLAGVLAATAGLVVRRRVLPSRRGK